MKRLKATVLAGAAAVLLHTSYAAAVPEGPAEPQIRRVRVLLAESERFRMTGDFRRGLGSGLAFLSRSADGVFDFLTINNAGSESTMRPRAPEGGQDNAEENDSGSGRVAPYIAHLTVRGDTATLHSPVVIKEPYRISPGGIALAGEGSVWIADEHGPALLRVALRDGSVTEMFRAGIELPAILMQRQNQKGFSGVSANGGKVFAAMQSTLNIQGLTKNTAAFTRLLELDGARRSVNMYALPVETDLYASRSETSIGDIAAIGERRFMMVEQGMKPGLDIATGIYLLDVNKPSRIESRSRNKKAPPIEPEFIPNPLAVFGKGNPIPAPVKKTLLVDLARYGVGFAKAEGLAPLDDGRTVVVSFEAQESKRDPNDELDTGMELWFVTLSKPFTAPRGKGVDLSGIGAVMGLLVVVIVALKFFARRRGRLS